MFFLNTIRKPSNAWFYVELSTLERVILSEALNSRMQGKMRRVALKHREETLYPSGEIVFIMCYVSAT